MDRRRRNNKIISARRELSLNWKDRNEVGAVSNSVQGSRTRHSYTREAGHDKSLVHSKGTNFWVNKSQISRSERNTTSA
jgi:hypothetical protein